MQEAQSHGLSMFARPATALWFGGFLLCAETCRHYDRFVALPGSWLALPIHDWAAALFLIWSAVRSRRDWVEGRPLQAAAWAFNLSLLTGALFGHLESLLEGPADPDWIPEPFLIGVIALMAFVALIALVSTFRSRTVASFDERVSRPGM